METQQALVIKRDELKDKMEQETRQASNRVAKGRYQWRNKPGEHLAKILQIKNQ